MIIGNLILILILVALNAFFASTEFAAVASRRARLELIAEEGSRSAEIVRSWLLNPAARDRLIAASQLGVTIVSLALGAVGENTFQALLVPFFDNLALPVNLSILEPILTILPLVLSLLIMTSLHVVLGEQVPKVTTLRNPERVALFAARPFTLFSQVFKWFIDILDWATRMILRLIGVQLSSGHSLLYTVQELKLIMNESEAGGVIETPEREMLHAVFDFGDLLVRQVMIPRTEIIAVEADLPLEEILTLITESTYTKFPVYDDTLDQILGVVHAMDILITMQEPGWQQRTVRALVREPLFIPETISVSSLLRQMRDRHQHIAIVLDEYGGTAGLVTLEDLLEEIVGEVSDPFDHPTPEFQTLPDGSVLIDGMTLIEDVNMYLGLDLNEPDYDTIAGFVLGKLGHIPTEKEILESDNVRLQVETMDGLRIAWVRLTHLPENKPAS